jgi:CDP-glycerol glycerophosphotransferase
MLVRDGNVSPWLVAADVLVSDHSSVGFEYLLLDRPLVRIAVPELIRRAKIPQEYVDLMAAASITVQNTREVLESVARGLDDRRQQSESRRHVASELFYKPGGATGRAVGELYGLMELTEPARERPVGDSTDSVAVLSRQGVA